MKPLRTKNEPIPSKALHPEKTALEQLRELKRSDVTEFCKEWMWNAKQFGDERNCMSMNNQQMYDCVSMIWRFWNMQKDKINSAFAEGLSEEEIFDEFDDFLLRNTDDSINNPEYVWKEAVKWANNQLTKRKIT